MRVPRVLRGGSWYYGNQDYLRASGRSWSYPSDRILNIYGFRCVRGDLSRVPRVLRGGSWRYDSQDYLRASGRSRDNPSLRCVIYGFRCVRGRSERKEN